MWYTRSFFDLQFAFAQRVAAHFALPLPDALRSYTTVATTLQLEDDWQAFAQQLVQSADPVALIYQTYCERVEPEEQPTPDSATFLGRPLFGCFYYDVLNGSTIRTHFINNDLPGMRPLGSERQAVRRDELRRMFTHIRDAVPEATTVAGHSWLYNLPAYTRLFPPSYSRETQENPDGVLNHVVLWYQCFDRFWQAKPDIAQELLRRVDQQRDLADLRFCFPYQRLRTRAPIADFYAFYGIPVSI